MFCGALILLHPLAASADMDLHDSIFNECTNAANPFTCLYDEQIKRMQRFDEIVQSIQNLLENSVQQVENDGVTEEQAERYRELAALSPRQQDERWQQYLSASEEKRNEYYGLPEAPLIARHAVDLSYRQAVTVNSLAMIFCAANVNACIESGYVGGILDVYADALPYLRNTRSDLTRQTSELSELLNQRP